jgi:hypothetical protein
MYRAFLLVVNSFGSKFDSKFLYFLKEKIHKASVATPAMEVGLTKLTMEIEDIERLAD